MYIIQSKTKTFVAYKTHTQFWLLFFSSTTGYYYIIVMPEPTDQKAYRVVVSISNINSTNNGQSSDERSVKQKNRIQKKHSLCNSIANDLKKKKKRHTYHVFHSNMYGYCKASNHTIIHCQQSESSNLKRCDSYKRAYSGSQCTKCRYHKKPVSETHTRIETQPKHK